MEFDHNDHLISILSALYISEGWNERWKEKKHLYSKMRAIVVYDRVINKEFHRFDTAKEESK